LDHLTEFEGGGSIRPQNMKILVLGSGGREHAVVWALRKTANENIHTYLRPGTPESQKTLKPFSLFQIIPSD
jgi:phosphoribosylamine-glycine ligase